MEYYSIFYIWRRQSQSEKKNASNKRTNTYNVRIFVRKYMCIVGYVYIPSQDKTFKIPNTFAFSADFKYSVAV